ncbi:integrase catalytic domain-containing protein, partial [Trichonephila clavipes]
KTLWQIFCFSTIQENIQEIVTLGDSRSIAFKRFDQLWRRLDRDPKLNNLYTKFIEEYLSLDHMEEITNIDDITSEEGFFLSHHGVLRAGNRSRPLRVVFNGSQKTDLDISLNPLTGYLPSEKLFRKRLTLILRFPSKMQQTFFLSPFRI